MQIKHILSAAIAMANTNGTQLTPSHNLVIHSLVAATPDAPAIEKWLGTLTQPQLLTLCGVMVPPDLVESIEKTYPGNIPVLVAFLDKLYEVANA